MPEFKVGDRVRVVSGHFYPDHTVGVVVEPTPGTLNNEGVFVVRFDHAEFPTSSYGDGWAYAVDELEPADPRTSATAKLAAFGEVVLTEDDGTETNWGCLDDVVGYLRGQHGEQTEIHLKVLA